MFLNVSLCALTRAVLMNPVESLRALPEAFRADPGAFTELPGALYTRIKFEVRDLFVKPEESQDFLRNLRR